MSSFPDTSPAVLLRAPWIIPVTSPVIPDGAVLVQGGRIRTLGPWSELSRTYSAIPVHTYQGVLMPGLVNAHIHLELSVFGTVKPAREDSTMCEWIRALLEKRMAAPFTGDEISAAAEKSAYDQYLSGVVLLLDTGNNRLPEFTCPSPEVYSLLEMLAPSREATETANATLGSLSQDSRVTGHAPYSTSPQLLQTLKKRSIVQGTLFSLHVAENLDEALLLFDGTGCFYEFLSDRGALDGTFPLEKGNNNSVLDYLDTLKILDEKTICVHCVHVSGDDIKIVARNKSHICLCPGSNRFLHVGRAPLELMLEHGIVPALGTDSIASNPVLDMWREMTLIREEFPTVSPKVVLRMATLGGARAMHRESDYGSLGCGLSSNFIAVEDERLADVQNGDQLLDMLTSMGRPNSVIRVQVS